MNGTPSFKLTPFTQVAPHGIITAVAFRRRRCIASNLAQASACVLRIPYLLSPSHSQLQVGAMPKAARESSFSLVLNSKLPSHTLFRFLVLNFFIMSNVRDERYPVSSRYPLDTGFADLYSGLLAFILFSQISPSFLLFFFIKADNNPLETPSFAAESHWPNNYREC